MPLQPIQFLLLCLYVLLPFATLARAVYIRLRLRRSAPLIAFLVSFVAAIIVAILLLLLNRRLMTGRIPADEAIRFIYLTLAAICFLRLLDYLLLRLLFLIGRIPTNAHGLPLPIAHSRALAVLLVQRILMLAFVLSYVPALIMTCRPRIIRVSSTLPGLSLSTTLAQFTTRDQLRLTGWWIAARTQPPQDVDPRLLPNWAQDAVILCHGVGSAKEDLLALAGFLADNGLNVLVFDFRAHGQSDGSFFSYGDRERLDVLAAAQWVKANHPDQSRRLSGIGINTGAAALIAAAVDPKQGQSLDALVLYEPFASFPSLVTTLTRQMLPGPVAWLVDGLGLRIASLHTGADLANFSPARLAPGVWPRPILLVHGRGTTFVPTTEEMDLYSQISYPRQQYWPAEAYSAARAHFRNTRSDSDLLTELFRQWLGTSNPITADRGVQDATLRFLINAHPLLAI